ncbi:MAG: TetR/AcrR family transcriptional regulator [Chitinophagaceae bacterium]|nr:TetR/AcrR family transcriptional regulator [Chitinophagaceae bacterium]
MNQKQRIIQKAEELFRQYGIRSVSMDDIAGHLGMSKKTLYQYFSEKDELVLVAVNMHIQKIEEECMACEREASDAIHEVFLMMSRILQGFSNLNPVVLYDLEKFHYSAYQRVLQHKEKFVMQQLRKNLNRGMREGLYRSDLNIDVLCKYRIHSMMLPFDIHIFPPGKYNLATTSEIILENFIYGLVSPKGYKLLQKYYENSKIALSHEKREF